MSQIKITEPAKADIQQAYEWWAKNRSADQAAEWYERIFEAIATLYSMSERVRVFPKLACPAPEYVSYFSVLVPARPIELSFTSIAKRTRRRFSESAIMVEMSCSD